MQHQYWWMKYEYNPGSVVFVSKNISVWVVTAWSSESSLLAARAALSARARRVASISSRWSTLLSSTTYRRYTSHSLPPTVALTSSHVCPTAHQPHAENLSLDLWPFDLLTSGSMQALVMHWTWGQKVKRSKGPGWVCMSMRLLMFLFYVCFNAIQFVTKMYSYGHVNDTLKTLNIFNVDQLKYVVMIPSYLKHHRNAEMIVYRLSYGYHHRTLAVDSCAWSIWPAKRCFSSPRVCSFLLTQHSSLVWNTQRTGELCMKYHIINKKSQSYGREQLRHKVSIGYNGMLHSYH